MEDEWLWMCILGRRPLFIAGCRCRSRNDWDWSCLYEQMLPKAGDTRAIVDPALGNKDWRALEIAMPKLEPPYLLLDGLQISGALL